MSTLGEIRTLILNAVARDDTVAVAIANAAINYATTLASLSFEPAEMFMVSEVTLTGDSNSLSISSLSSEAPIMADRLLNIVKIHNDTNGYKLSFIPYEMWDSIIPSGLEVTKFWSIFGQTLYFKAAPSSSNTLTISHSIFPAQMVNATDEIPFGYYDAYILSTATGICWAAFEESESSEMWNKISNIVGSSYSLGTRAQAIIEGRRTLLESAIAQSKEI